MFLSIELDMELTTYFFNIDSIIFFHSGPYSYIPVNRPEFGGAVPILSTVSHCPARGTNVLNFRGLGWALPHGSVKGRFSYTHRPP